MAHLALSYTQPYVMVCSGAPFVVADGSGFNFERDFNHCHDRCLPAARQRPRASLYKGTASDVPVSQTQTSFRVTLTSKNEVRLEVANADGSDNGGFTGPITHGGPVLPGANHQAHQDPYGERQRGQRSPTAPPFDPSQMTALPQPRLDRYQQWEDRSFRYQDWRDALRAIRGLGG